MGQRRRKITKWDFSNQLSADLGWFRCSHPHVEMANNVRMRSRNGLSLTHPDCDIEISADIKVRDFTEKRWAEVGAGAHRKNMHVIVDLENGKLLWKGDALQVVNLQEVLEAIHALLTGAKSEPVTLDPNGGTVPTNDNVNQLEEEPR